jgi:hypothetical protein
MQKYQRSRKSSHLGAVCSIPDLTRSRRGVCWCCYFSHPSAASSLGERFLAKTDVHRAVSRKRPLSQTSLSGLCVPKMRLRTERKTASAPVGKVRAVLDAKERNDDESQSLGRTV